LHHQNNIAEGTYPLARDLYIINCQGYSGLGMGFPSFVAGIGRNNFKIWITYGCQQKYYIKSNVDMIRTK
jgi:hypothetical protein